MAALGKEFHSYHLMDRECHRGFQYHAVLPYPTDTTESSLRELAEIVERIRDLAKTNQFQHYEFGTAYAHEAAVATRDLLRWTRRKLDVPLDLKLELTQIYLEECFKTVEPSLFVRYGTLVLSLWQSSESQQQLHQLYGTASFVDFKRMANMIRNTVIVADTRPSEITTSRPDRLTGVGGNTGSPSESRKLATSANIALKLARQFVPCLKLTEEIMQYLNDEILCFIGIPGHVPSQSAVLCALCSLIPYADPKSAEVYIPVLFGLWNKVPLETANRHIMPAIAEFTVYNALSNTSLPIFSDEQLSICFQSVLHSMQIPLISAQKAGNHWKYRNSSTNSSGSGVSTGLGKSKTAASSTSSSGSDGYAFAKLLVWNLSYSDTRTLDLFDSFVNAVLSFCHPSNIGVWTSLILSTLSEVVTAYTRRLNTEKTGEMQVSSQHKLCNADAADAITDRLVEIVKHPVMMSVYSNSSVIFTQAVHIYRGLALLSPDKIVNDVLAVVYPTLQHGLHQPQRMIASVACLEQLAVPLTSNPRYKMHLTTLLELTIPNLDTNDAKRCFLTMSLFQTIASLCKFEDVSDGITQAVAAQMLPAYVRGLEEGINVEISEQDAEKITTGTTAAYPELLLMYMRRIFELLETTAEQKLSSAAPASVLRVLLSCSRPIFDRLLNMTLTEISNPQQQTHDSFAQVCGSFVRANCFVAFPKMWKLLVTNIREEILENQAGSQRVVMPKDSSLLRYMSVLNMCLLAANPHLLLDIADELRDLLKLVREKTSASVVYTVANTIHHAIGALVGYSVVLPSPSGEYSDDGNDDKYSKTQFLNLKWNAPTADSYRLAETLFIEHVDISETQIMRSLANASTNVQDGDAVSSALIFIRTATGAIAPMATKAHPKVLKCRAKVARLLMTIYPQLSRDDISSLKEVLFVAKVWLCDVRYERTARLDTHQCNLYLYEKRQFEVAGAHKTTLPPAIMARRAQLYHHQVQALYTQIRDCDSTSKNMMINVLADACFSFYPAVRRNAFSALYSPLKIFSDNSLYEAVYILVLDKIEQSLDEEEYERAEGGFNLLKYRSFGLHTVGKNPKLFLRFVKLCMRGAAADHRELSTVATHVFFILLPDVLRIGMTESLDANAVWKYISEVIEFLISEPLDTQHWREGLFRTSALMTISQFPQIPLNARVLRLLLHGSLVHHPDVRLTAILASLNVLQSAFSYGMAGYDIDFYRIEGKIAVPFMVSQTTDNSLPENDLSSFIKRSPLPIIKALKTQQRPNENLLKLGSHATEPVHGFWRIHHTDGILQKLSESDRAELKSALTLSDTQEFWERFIKIRRLEPRAEEDKLNRPSALFFRDMIALSSLGFGVAANNIVNVINNSVDLSDKNWHRVAAEALCGLIMALPLDKNESLVGLIEKLLSAEVVASFSSENIGYWASAIAFSVPNVDYRRLKSVISNIEAISRPNTSSDGGGIKLSLRTVLHTELMEAIGTKHNCLDSVSANWPHWNHSLQTTRETAIEEISTAVSTTLQWHHPAEARREHVKLDDKTTKYLESLFDIDATKSEISLLGLILQLLHILGGDACVDVLISRGFPLLLRLSAVRDDPEILVLVTQVFSELSITEFTGESLNRMVDLVATSVHSDQWHQRMRILLFIQSFYFNHLLLMTPEQRRTLTMISVESLADQQAEVRELAADTFSGIVRCSPQAEQTYYVSTLTSKFMKSISKKTALIQRHAAVLGLGALIVAFPYASPPPSWIPTVLAAIASKAAGDSDIVGKSAKQVLSDFKKTRQDTWHIDQLAFSQDQLDDLDGVLWRNYFA